MSKFGSIDSKNFLCNINKNQRDSFSELTYQAAGAYGCLDSGFNFFSNLQITGSNFFNKNVTLYPKKIGDLEKKKLKLNSIILFLNDKEDEFEYIFYLFKYSNESNEIYYITAKVDTVNKNKNKYFLFPVVHASSLIDNVYPRIKFDSCRVTLKTASLNKVKINNDGVSETKKLSNSKCYLIEYNNIDITIEELRNKISFIQVPKNKNTEKSNIYLSKRETVTYDEELKIVSSPNSSYYWESPIIYKSDNKKGQEDFAKGGWDDVNINSPIVLKNMSVADAVAKFLELGFLDNKLCPRAILGNKSYGFYQRGMRIENNVEFNSGDEILKIRYLIVKASNNYSKLLSTSLRSVKNELKLNSNSVYVHIRDIYDKISFENEKIKFDSDNVKFSNGRTEYGYYCYFYNVCKYSSNIINEINDLIIKYNQNENFEIYAGTLRASALAAEKFNSDDRDLISFKTELNRLFNNKKEDIIRSKLSNYIDNIDRKFFGKIKEIYGNKISNNFLKSNYLEALEALLLKVFINDDEENINNFISKLNTIDAAASLSEINNVFDNFFEQQDTTESKTIKQIIKNFYLDEKLANKLFKSIKKVNAQNEEYENYNILELTCKARKKIKIKSWSNLYSDKTQTALDKHLATIIPSNESLQEADESQYNKLNIAQVEDYIQTWMVKGDEKDAEKTEALPIEGYYDFFTGMTPYVNMKFRCDVRSLVATDEDAKNYITINGEKIISVDDWKTMFKEKQNIVGAIEEVCKQYHELDTVNYPEFFRSLNIEDNGVKKITLTLFDPNFSSFTVSKKDVVFSLESIIRGAINNPFFSIDKDGNINDTDTYSSSDDFSGGIGNQFLNISEGFKLGCTNLKIRFGYADTDITAFIDTDGTRNFNNSNYENEYREAFKKRFPGKGKRNSRWWDVVRNGGDDVDETKKGITEDFNGISKIKKYIDENYRIANKEAEWIPIVAEVVTNAEGKKETRAEGTADMRPVGTGGEVNNIGGSLSISTLMKNTFQTTKVSDEYDFMITDFESEIQSDGIQYTIKAIEAKDTTTLKTRFLQRFAEITANPEEMLYMLMHMFNEGLDGENIEGSNVKICLMEDTNDPYMKDILNMSYDYKKMSADELDGTEAEDLYTMACYGNGVSYNEKFLKEITINLGSDDATRNYNRFTSGKKLPPLYKTVAQLMNEFCALCPPKVEKKFEDEDKVDEDGNKILNNQKNFTSRPLKWFTFQDKKTGVVYICLYYRRINKPERIRVYTYGVNNPVTSCVKSLRIKNSNEFAVLNGVRAFKSSNNGSLHTRMVRNGNSASIDKNGGKESNLNSLFNEGTKAYELIGEETDEYLNAFSSSMYEGTMEILGDPFFNFDGILQPYTFPIEVNVLIPQSEFMLRAINGSDTYRKQIQELISKNMPRFAYAYSGTGWYDRGKGNDGGGAFISNELERIETSNQILHENSGYYVVSKINHSITQGDFTTTLSIISYPNIQNDVLGKKTEKKLGHR